MRVTAVGLWLCVVTAVPATCAAQSIPGNPRLRFGNIALQPRLTIGNVGLDTNVLNSPTGVRDFSATVTPSLEAWWQIGRSLLSGVTSSELLFFARSENQRAAGLSQTGKYEVFLARLTPFFSAGRTTTHQRPNAEIDVRALQRNVSMAFGTVVIAGPDTRVVLSFTRDTTKFENELTDQGNLAELNRRTQKAEIAVRRTLTPLTTWVTLIDLQGDRFSTSGLRNADSVAVLSGFELKRSALISGSGYVGFRRVAPVSDALPSFSGLVATVSARYVLRDFTRFDVTADRAFEFSVEDEQPAYVLTGGSVSITQSLGERWDAVFRVGKRSLAYQPQVTAGLAPGVVPAPGRKDRVVEIAGGAGFSLSETARIGFEATFNRRLSILVNRQYQGYRFGGTFTYVY